MKDKVMVLLALLAMTLGFTACGDEEEDQPSLYVPPTDTETKVDVVLYDYIGSMAVLVGNSFDCDDINDARVTIAEKGDTLYSVTMHPFALDVQQMGLNVGLNQDIVITGVMSRATADGYTFKGTFSQQASTSYAGYDSERTLSGTVVGELMGEELSCAFHFPAMGWEGMPMSLDFTFTGIKEAK